jgi:hypothetical protein
MRCSGECDIEAHCVFGSLSGLFCFRLSVVTDPAYVSFRQIGGVEARLVQHWTHTHTHRVSESVNDYNSGRRETFSMD